MRVIDFRLRPPLRGFLDTAQYADIERSKGLARKFGVELPASAAEKSMDKLFEEMAAAGVEKGVVPGRCSAVFGRVSNDDVAAITKAYPDRFIGYASADPTIWRTAVRDTEAALKKGQGRGAGTGAARQPHAS